MNIINENKEKSKRYLPHDIKTRENAVKTYRNGNSNSYVLRKYHISSKQYTEEGIRLRLLGENMPSESGCIACDVTLEDAYIYVTNR